MKFTLVCALILSIACLLATAQPIDAKFEALSQDHGSHEHSRLVRSLNDPILSADDDDNSNLKKDGKVGCCG